MITPFFRFVSVHAVWHAGSYFPEVKVKVSRVQLSVPVDYTFPGILLARILQWIVCSLLQGFFPTQGSNPGLPHLRQILYQVNHNGCPTIYVAYVNKNAKTLSLVLKAENKSIS
jgi:hypothetical protein